VASLGAIGRFGARGLRHARQLTPIELRAIFAKGPYRSSLAGGLHVKRLAAGRLTRALVGNKQLGRSASGPALPRHLQGQGYCWCGEGIIDKVLDVKRPLQAGLRTLKEYALTRTWRLSREGEQASIRRMRSGLWAVNRLMHERLIENRLDPALRRLGRTAARATGFAMPGDFSKGPGRGFESAIGAGRRRLTEAAAYERRIMKPLITRRRGFLGLKTEVERAKIPAAAVAERNRLRGKDVVRRALSPTTEPKRYTGSPMTLAEHEQLAVATRVALKDTPYRRPRGISRRTGKPYTEREIMGSTERAIRMGQVGVHRKARGVYTTQSNAFTPSELARRDPEAAAFYKKHPELMVFPKTRR